MSYTLDMKKSQSKSKRKPKRKDEEGQTQQAYFRWTRAISATNWKYEFIHSHQYVRTSIGVMIKMRKEGLCRGVADVEIPYPNHGCPALYIEFKTKYGQLKPHQKRFRAYCQRVGAPYVVCRNLRDAQLITQWYLTNFEN